MARLVLAIQVAIEDGVPAELPHGTATLRPQDDLHNKHLRGCPSSSSSSPSPVRNAVMCENDLAVASLRRFAHRDHSNRRYYTTGLVATAGCHT